MTLLSILNENKEKIRTDWLDAIFRTYPLDTVGFMRNKKDQFQNPVGFRTENAVNAIVDALLCEGLEFEAVQGPLDDIVRIRSVQDFTAAGAIGVVYLLKPLIRGMLDKELDDPALARELLGFESKIDSMALISIDIYAKCQKQIYDLRVNEVKNSQSRLLKRAKMICETPAEAPDTPNNGQL